MKNILVMQKSKILFRRSTHRRHKCINSNEVTGLDLIPLKLIKCTTDIIDIHITNILNKGFKENRYSESDETAIVEPIYKNSRQHKDRGNIKIYRPVTILNGFSKIYERVLHNN